MLQFMGSQRVGLRDWTITTVWPRRTLTDPSLHIFLPKLFIKLKFSILLKWASFPAWWSTRDNRIAFAWLGQFFPSSLWLSLLSPSPAFPPHYHSYLCLILLYPPPPSFSFILKDSICLWWPNSHLAHCTGLSGKRRQSWRGENHNHEQDVT